MNKKLMVGAVTCGVVAVGGLVAYKLYKRKHNKLEEGEIITVDNSLDAEMATTMIMNLLENDEIDENILGSFSSEFIYTDLVDLETYFSTESEEVFETKHMKKLIKNYKKEVINLCGYVEMVNVSYKQDNDITRELKAIKETAVKIIGYVEEFKNSRGSECL